jgi:hypothetical protein
MSAGSLQNFLNPKASFLWELGGLLASAMASPISAEAGWGNRLYLVNSSGGQLHGQDVYRRVRDIPSPADLAIVIVPAEAVPGVMEEIGERGIKSVIIETAGLPRLVREGGPYRRGLRLLPCNTVSASSGRIVWVW